MCAYLKYDKTRQGVQPTSAQPECFKGEPVMVIARSDGYLQHACLLPVNNQKSEPKPYQHAYQSQRAKEQCDQFIVGDDGAVELGQQPTRHPGDRWQQ